jgi:hypothetical protein
MKKLILKMSIALDGFGGGADGAIDWLFTTLDEDAKKWIADTVGKAGVHIMGSRTFADMAAYWPGSTDVLAAPMNRIPKVVFRGARTRPPLVLAVIEAAPVDPGEQHPVPGRRGGPRVPVGALRRARADPEIRPLTPGDRRDRNASPRHTLAHAARRVAR